MTRWLCRLRMRAIVTTWAVVCVVLVSCGRSAANVTIIALEPAADRSDNSSAPLNCLTELEVLDDQSRDLAADFGRLAQLGDIIPCNTAGWTDVAKADGVCSPWQMASPLGGAKGSFALTVAECSASLLPPNTFSSVHASNIAYTDSTLFADGTALGEVTLEPAVPTGAIVLAALGAGLIGWSWRRRVLSRWKYP